MQAQGLLRYLENPATTQMVTSVTSKVNLFHANTRQTEVLALNETVQ